MEFLPCASLGLPAGDMLYFRVAVLWPGVDKGERGLIVCFRCRSLPYIRAVDFLKQKKRLLLVVLSLHDLYKK